MNFPRLDDLPKNADRLGVRIKLIEAMVAIDLDCDFDTMLEHYTQLLEQQYMMCDDIALQEIYDECFKDYNEEEDN